MDIEVPSEPCLQYQISTGVQHYIPGALSDRRGRGGLCTGRGRAIRSDNAHSSSTDTKELQWYNVSTTKVFVRYKTEKQVKSGLLYSKFMTLWWESSDRFMGEYNSKLGSTAANHVQFIEVGMSLMCIVQLKQWLAIHI